MTSTASEITARRAAEILGVTDVELARMLADLVQQRLAKIGTRIDSFEIGTLEQLDEELAQVRVTFTSLVAAWAAVDATPDETEED